MLFHFIEESGLKSIAEISVIEMLYRSPKAVIGITTFRNKAVNMWIPFKRTTKSMKHTNKTGDEVFGFIQPVKHTKDNTTDSMKKAVQKRAVFQKKMAQFFVDGKNTMPMSTVDKFKGHTGRTFMGIFHTAGRAETAFAAERNELHVVAGRADIHGTAKRRVATMNHLRDVFHFDIPGMKSILNDFIIVFKNFL